jgi:hypothetical protein
MPRFENHVRSCRRFGLSREICEEVNRHMDEPFKRIIGCGHRKFRHQPNYCELIAQNFKRKALIEGKSEAEASKIYREAYSACILHIRDDCKKSSRICKRSLSCEKVEKLLKLG